MADAERDGECREALYRIRTERGSEVQIREDLVESLLDRGAVGMKLKRMRGKG